MWDFYMISDVGQLTDKSPFHPERSDNLTEEYDDTLLYSNKAYQYAQDVINGDIVAGKYVKIVCQNFLDDIDKVDDEDFPYFFDTELVELVQNLCKLLNMASGVESGGTVYDALGGFQWFFILSVLCWKHADNPDKRRYEQSVLLIARKSGSVLPL